jgi:nucleotide-binding universal stress UspA family protein
VFKKILVCYDGSEYAKKALSVALDMAKKYEGEITAVAVAHVPEFAGTRDEIDGSIEDARNYFDKAFEEARGIAENQGVKLTTRMLVGHPADTLTTTAENEGFELMVIGARGLSGIKRYLLGSVSTAVARLAHCPVLIVKK